MRSLFIHFDRLGSFVVPKSMGAQISKTAGKEEAAVEKAAEGAAVAAKSNGQVNEVFNISKLTLVWVFLSHFFAMCCVNGVLLVPCSASPRSPAFQGKWPHVKFHRRVNFFPKFFTLCTEKSSRIHIFTAKLREFMLVLY